MCNGNRAIYIRDQPVFKQGQDEQDRPGKAFRLSVFDDKPVVQLSSSPAPQRNQSRSSFYEDVQAWAYQSERHKMTFNDFKAYRAIWRPVWELKKWRARRPASKFLPNVRFTIFIVGAVLLGSCEVVKAQDVDLDKIAMIESTCEPLAYNKNTGATGEYQLTAGVLQTAKDDGEAGDDVKLEEMFDPQMARIVANWFINDKIPSWLKIYHIPDTITTRLIAYNWGIGHLRRWFKHGAAWHRLPAETRGYIKKYFKGVDND